MNARRMMTRITTTNQKKNTTIPGIAYPATVLALATDSSYPSPPQLSAILYTFMARRQTARRPLRPASSSRPARAGRRPAGSATPYVYPSTGVGIVHGTNDDPGCRRSRGSALGGGGDPPGRRAASPAGREAVWPGVDRAGSGGGAQGGAPGPSGRLVGAAADGGHRARGRGRCPRPPAAVDVGQGRLRRARGRARARAPA